MSHSDVMLPPVLPLVADARRWRLLVALARSDRRVGELTELLDLPQNLVSYHLRELRDAGLVSSRRSSADGRDVYYRVDLTRCRELLAASAAEMHPGLALQPAPPPHRQLVGRRRPRVLFLCTGNSARSQIAEVLLTHRSAGGIETRSAGSTPKPLHPLAVEVMAERGIDIASAKSKHLRRFVRTRFDRVVTLCDKVREVCPEFPAMAAAHWSIPDPAAVDPADQPAAFRSLADELDVRTEMLLAELCVPVLRPEVP